MNYPLTKKQLLKQIACETARMSYPGSMSRGAKQVVKLGTKLRIENYFVNRFPLAALYADVDQVAHNYDTWHEEQTQALGRLLLDHNCLGNPENNAFAVGAKFINTFMHQLMKYSQFRPLWAELHLPLDARVFQSFAKITDSPAIIRIKERIGARSAYALSYDDYKFVQDVLREFISELNRRPGMEFHNGIPYWIANRTQLSMALTYRVRF
jgi:hypothetical protein